MTSILEGEMLQGLFSRTIKIKTSGFALISVLITVNPEWLVWTYRFQVFVTNYILVNSTLHFHFHECVLLLCVVTIGKWYAKFASMWSARILINSPRFDYFISLQVIKGTNKPHAPHLQPLSRDCTRQNNLSDPDCDWHRIS